MNTHYFSQRFLFILKTAVDARFIAQHLDSSSYMKIVLITKKVTTQIFITLSKSICYTLNSHATAVLRFMLWKVMLFTYD
jgi:hypothetical protein